MPKNIVFCADGTWNGPGESDSDDPNAPWTNVYKLFLNLAGQDDPASTRLGKEQERTATGNNGAVTQVAKYLHGVGDSNNWLDKMLGGGLGLGLITRIVRGYTFISRNYQADDSIFLIGFSRGAYTARALAGLISAKGLLPPDIAAADDKFAAYRAGAAVWVQWRSEVHAGNNQLLDRLDGLLLDLPGFLLRPPDPGRLVPAPIKAVAVWDTVGALGIPLFTSQALAIDLFQFADRSLNANISYGRHAVAVDEQRADFTPTPWDNPNPDDNRIVQVLFPGGHADVGGGYPLPNNESGLSNGPLGWMRRELAQLPDGSRVLFGPAPPNLDQTPGFNGPSHEEWLKPLWAVLPRRPRGLANGLAVCDSVVNRMNGGAMVPTPGAAATPYRPSNIAVYVPDVVAPARYAAEANVQVIPLT